jgi:hypothetical protein
MKMIESAEIEKVINGAEKDIFEVIFAVLLIHDFKLQNMIVKYCIFSTSQNFGLLISRSEFRLFKILLFLIR